MTMFKKITSVFQDNNLGIRGDTPIILSEQEANMICNAMTICLPKEYGNVMPILELTNKIVAENKEYQENQSEHKGGES